MTNNLTIEQHIDAIHQEVMYGDKTLDFLNLLAIGLGFYNTLLNRKQIDNNAIMAELDKQDRVYFEKILKILEELKGVKNDDE